MITRTKTRERPSLLPPFNAPSANDERPRGPPAAAVAVEREEELTTMGRTYEELVSASHQQQQHRESMMSDDTEESEPSREFGRQSVGFMLGRNSLSNWSTIGGGKKGLLNDQEDEEEDDNGDNSHTGNERSPSNVHMEHNNILNTGRKSNVTRTSFGSRDSLGLATPNILMASHINVSQRRSNQVITTHGTSQRSVGRAGGSGRPSSLNMSHISSSSSSGFMDEEDAFDDSLNPIRTSLEESFADTNLSPIRLERGRQQSSDYLFQKSASKSPPSAMRSLSPKRNDYQSQNSVSRSPPSAMRSLSPKRNDSHYQTSASKSPPTAMRSLSPKRSSTTNMAKSPIRSPVRSPLGNISPNRSRAMSVDLHKKKALSPNGTYSLKEAEGTRMSMPTFSTTTTNAQSSSGSSSNMSVGSGSETMSVPVAFSASKASTSKLVLPSLSASRRDRHTAESVVAPPKPTTEDVETVMLLSPEKELTKVRSPEPTPNSQRRIIKRLRASIPSAKYLMPEDMVEEEAPVKVVSRAEHPTSTTNDVSISETSAEPIRNEVAMPTTYENAFVFPRESIPFPRTETLCLFHDQAIAMGSPSHQYQLNCAKANLLSLQEVILPSIAYETNAVLKQMQAKAQRNVRDGMPASEGTEVVKAIETCRMVVTKCTDEAMKLAGAAWREREAKRQQLRMEKIESQERQHRLDELVAKKERKESRARSRQERYERQKVEKQRNHPRNKEMWQEVAKLMVEIQKLEKEERLWNETLVEVKQLEEHHQPPEKIELDIIVEGAENGEVRASTDPESMATTLVGDVTLATERVNWVLKSVSLAMTESDKLRREAYEKYQDDGHKFYGYPMVDDPKALFKSLAMGSPF
ncbi:hypothetical protein ACHAXH_004559 [Discostella pseudostelligera]